MKEDITQDRLKELLNYDNETGIFTWKIFRNNRAKTGYIAGLKNSDGYIRISIDKRMYLAHRLAWLYMYGEVAKNFIDHVDGVKTNNSIKNLRESTNEQNLQNIKKSYKNNSCGILGVYFNKANNNFRAQIRANGITKSLGSFKTPEEARQAYIKAKRELHPFGTL
jgi:hypothetical protein